MEDEKKGTKLSRRSFLKGIGGGAVGTAVISTGLVKSDPAKAYSPEAVGAHGKTPVTLKVNGKTYRVEVEHRNTLAEVLRDELGLTGTKIGCDRGECGACTVIINGRNMYRAVSSPSGWRGKTSSPSKAWRKATSSIRCRKHLLNMIDHSAAFALPVRSCRVKRC